MILLALLITGITLVSHVSWFNLMDRLGYQAFMFGGWLKQKFDELSDRKQGAIVRKEREETVKEIREAFMPPSRRKIGKNGNPHEAEANAWRASGAISS